MCSQPDPLTLRDAIYWAESIFESAEIDSPRADAEWIVGDILSIERPKLYLKPDTRLTKTQIERLRNLVSRRGDRVPLQHLLGYTEFFSLPFLCSPNALIPRPETEILVETAISYLLNRPMPRILDLCTGSGVIAVSLAHNLPDAEVVAADLSISALLLARQNARKNCVSGRISRLRAHLLSSILDQPVFHAIVANPPYVATQALSGLQTEVRDFDPALALNGGPDGLTLLRQIISEAPSLLLENGFLLLETGHDQPHQVAALMATSLRDVSIVKDLTGTDRFVVGFRKPRKGRRHSAVA